MVINGLYFSSGNAPTTGRGRGRGNSHSSPLVKNIKQEMTPQSQWKPEFPMPTVDDIDICGRGKLTKFPGTGKATHNLFCTTFFFF